MCAPVLTTSSCSSHPVDFPFLPQGYGLPVVCTECSGSTDSESVRPYPKDCQGLKTVENTHPNALSSREHQRKRGAGTSLLHGQPCNGIASGRRVETDGTLYPSNHDRIRPEGAHGTSFLGSPLIPRATSRAVAQPHVLPSAWHGSGGAGLGRG